MVPDDPRREDGEPVHRPLPSVDMPLLRPQLRASRNRQAVTAVAGLVASVVLVGAAILLVSQLGEDDDEGSHIVPGAPEGWEAHAAPAETTPEPPEAAAAATADEPATPAASPTGPVTPGAVSRTESLFGQAHAFRQALQNAGLGREEYLALEQALDGVMDFRRCRPTDRMVMERDRDGTLVRWEYHANPTEFVLMTRGNTGDMVATREEVPVQRVRLARGGRVRTSLGEALEQIGLGRSLVGVFVEVFEGRVNFTTQAREGDTFRLVVDEERIDGELLRYGTVYALEYVGQRVGTLRGFYHESRGGRGDYYDETGRAVHGGWLRPPLRYDRISSRFNPRRMHPILRRIVPHNGIDYAASRGTPVWAAADGVVTWAGPKGPNGNLVAIRHEGGFESFYAHLQAINRGIRPGAEVRQRQGIGAVGSTGRSTGPHLHFGLKRRGNFVDPQTEIDGPGRMMPSSELPAFRREVRELRRELERVDVGGPPPALDTTSAPADEPEEESMD